MTVEGDHFYVDLVFCNRLLRSFVLIDLELGKLTHQDLGQMQMYVNYSGGAALGMRYERMCAPRRSAPRERRRPGLPARGRYGSDTRSVPDDHKKRVCLAGAEHGRNIVSARSTSATVSHGAAVRALAARVERHGPCYRVSPTRPGKGRRWVPNTKDHQDEEEWQCTHDVP